MVMLSNQVSELDLDDFDGQITQTIVLSDISWKTYRAMLADMGDHRATRLAYYQGVLTLKMPSKLHEIINRLLARIVTTLTEELNLEVVNIGSTTLERDDIEAGAEADTAFYIQNADQVQGLDPQIPDHLPPDLVVEVDITSPSTKRLKICQALGVKEVWQYTKRRGLVFYQLETREQVERSPRNSPKNGYVEIDASIAFPQITPAKPNQLLQQRKTQSENQIIRTVRSWIQPLD